MFFSDFLFATAKVAYITAMIILHLILHSTVHIYDFHIFITSSFRIVTTLLQHCSNIAKLCCIKNGRCESSSCNITFKLPKNAKCASLFAMELGKFLVYAGPNHSFVSNRCVSQELYQTSPAGFFRFSQCRRHI